MHNIDWSDYRYFLHVARAGSFKAAAEVMGVNQSTVFRRIEALEAKLQVRLFERAQTGTRLTPHGEVVLEDVEAVEARLQNAERRVLGADVRLSGTLKISTSDTLGYYWLPSRLAAFKARYPDILVDLDVTTQYRNLSKREADVVLSTAVKQPDTMVGAALAPIDIAFYASASYLARAERPTSVGDLAAHDMLLPGSALAGLALSKWLARHVPASAAAMLSDKFTSLYHLCKEGLGIAPLPSYVPQPGDGLQRLMPAGGNHGMHIWLLTHPDIRHSARVAAFMDFLRG